MSCAIISNVNHYVQGCGVYEELKRLVPFVPRRVLVKLLNEVKNGQAEGSGYSVGSSEASSSSVLSSVHHESLSLSTKACHGPFSLDTETEMNVSLLFIDMSGFTSSMERFSAYGFAGIESFWRIVNSFFGSLLREICNRGGDVECFAGDAMLIAFRPSIIVDSPICQAIRASALQKQCGYGIQEQDGLEAFLPDLSRPNWAAVLASLLVVDAAASILRASPYEISNVKIGKQKSPLSIHLALHGGIGTGTCMFNKFVASQGSSFRKKSWFFPFGLAIFDMTNAHHWSKSGEVILTSNVIKQMFPSSQSIEGSACRDRWVESGWMKKREDGTFLLYSNDGALALPPPLLGGILFVDFLPESNVWPEYSAIDAVLSHLNLTSLQQHDPDKLSNACNVRLLTTVTNLVRRLSTYMPIQLTELIENRVMGSQSTPRSTPRVDENKLRGSHRQTISGKKSADRKGVGRTLRGTNTWTPSTFSKHEPLFSPPLPSPQISSSLASMVGELREATVGFVKFDTTSLMDLNIKNSKMEELHKSGGYLSVAWEPPTKVRPTPRDEMAELQNIISECVDAADAVLSYGGLVNKFLMDDKGLSMLFAFGTPGFSYEGNSTKALSAALDIRMRIGKLRKNGFGIGVATGQICVSILGLQSIRCEYALVGSSINLASRIAEHSLKLGNGLVLTESRTIGLKMSHLSDDDQLERIALKPGITVHSFRSLKLKGKSETTRIYTAKREQLKINVNWEAQKIWMGMMPRRSSRGPIGREKEFQELIRHLSLDNPQPKDGMSRCFFVEGEPGMGKSHILNRIVSFCGGADPDTMRTRFLEPRTGRESFLHMEVQRNSGTGSCDKCNRRFSFPNYAADTDVEAYENTSVCSRDGSHSTRKMQGCATNIVPRPSVHSTIEQPSMDLRVVPPLDNSTGLGSSRSITHHSSAPIYKPLTSPSTLTDGESKFDGQLMRSHPHVIPMKAADVEECTSMPVAVFPSDKMKLPDVQLMADEVGSVCHSIDTSLTTSVTTATRIIAVAFHSCSAAEQLQPLWPAVNLVTQLLAMCLVPHTDGSFAWNDVYALLSRQNIRDSPEWTVEDVIVSLELVGLRIDKADDVHRCPHRQSTRELSSPFHHLSLPIPSLRRGSSSNLFKRRLYSRSSRVSIKSELAIMQQTQMYAEAVLCVLSAVCNKHGALVVIIDEVHMMDSSMMKLMLGLVTYQHNVTFVLASSGKRFVSPATLRYYTELRSLEEDKCIVLEPLEPDRARRLTSHFLGVHGIDDMLLELIVQTCNGRPVFIKQVCDELVAQGAVVAGCVHSLEEISAVSSFLELSWKEKVLSVRKKNIDIDFKQAQHSPGLEKMKRAPILNVDNKLSHTVHAHEEPPPRSYFQEKKCASIGDFEVPLMKTLIGEERKSTSSIGTTSTNATCILSTLTGDHVAKLDDNSEEEISDELWDEGRTFAFLLPMKKGFAIPSCISKATVANVDSLQYPIDGVAVKVSSVIGEFFSAEVLFAVMPKHLTMGKLLDSLQRLCYHGLLKPAADVQRLGIVATRASSLREGQHYSFVNFMVWKSCYEMLLLHYRRGLHINIARVLLNNFMKEKDSSTIHACLYHILQATLSSAPSKEEIDEIGPLVWMQTLREGIVILTELLEDKFIVLYSVGKAQDYVVKGEDMIKSYREWLEKFPEDDAAVLKSDAFDILLMEYKLMLIRCRIMIEVTGSTLGYNTEGFDHAVNMQCDPRLALNPKLNFKDVIQPHLYKAYVMQCYSSNYTFAWDVLGPWYESVVSKTTKLGGFNAYDTQLHQKMFLEMASLFAMGAIRLGNMKQCDLCIAALKNWDGWEPLCLLSHDSVAMLLGVVMLTRGLLSISDKVYWNERQCLLKHCKSSRQPSMVWKVFGWLCFTWFALGEARSCAAVFKAVLQDVSLECIPKDVYDLNLEMMSMFCELWELVKDAKGQIKKYKKTRNMEFIIDKCSDKLFTIEQMLHRIIGFMNLKRTPMACCIAFEASILAMDPNAREEALNLWDKCMPPTLSLSSSAPVPKNQKNLLEHWLDLCKAKHIIMKFEELDENNKIWGHLSAHPLSKGFSGHLSVTMSENIDESSTLELERLNEVILKLESQIEEARNSKHIIRVIQLICLKTRARVLLGDPEKGEEELKPIVDLVSDSEDSSRQYSKICDLYTVHDALRLYEIVKSAKHKKKLGKKTSWSLKSIYQDQFSCYGELSFFDAIENGQFNQEYYGPTKVIRGLKKYSNAYFIEPATRFINYVMMVEKERKGVGLLSTMRKKSCVKDEDLELIKYQISLQDGDELDLDDLLDLGVPV